MKLKTFFKQCHKKEVFKMLSIYVVSSWILLQVLAVIAQPLGLPQTTVTYLIIILLIGFPIYVLYIWKTKVVPSEKLLAEVDLDGLKKKKEFKKMYFSSLAMVTAMCLISVMLIVNNNFGQSSNVLKSNQSDKIAVLKFGNNTGNPDYDIVSKMASDWIMHGITQNNAGQVITQDVLDEYNEALNVENKADDVNTLVRKYLNPSKIISGNYFLKDGKLLFQCTVKDGKNDKSLIALETDECSTDDALTCIDDLKESIVGFLVTEGRQKEMLLQDKPPKYDSYKFLLEAKSSLSNDEYLDLLNKSIKADPSYFEPKVLRVAHYYNMKRYAQADSLLKIIQPDSHNNKRQLNLLNTYSALLKGNNKNVYKSILEEYTVAPFDLKSNKSAMVIALQYVNRPKDVEPIFNAIKMDSIDLDNCMDCVFRVLVNSLANIELKKYNEVITMLEPITSPTENSSLFIPYIIACIRAGLDEKLTPIVRDVSLLGTSEMLAEINLLSGKEYLLAGKLDVAKAFFEETIITASKASNEKIKADALFYLDDFSEARKIYEKLLSDNTENVNLLTRLAICHHKLGLEHRETAYLEKMEILRGPYTYGRVDYALASYFAAKGDGDNVIRHLLKSVADGNIYTANTFYNDPQFVAYRNSEAFKRILNFWH